MDVNDVDFTVYFKEEYEADELFNINDMNTAENWLSKNFNEIDAFQTDSIESGIQFFNKYDKFESVLEKFNEIFSNIEKNLINELIIENKNLELIVEERLCNLFKTKLRLKVLFNQKYNELKKKMIMWRHNKTSQVLTSEISMEQNSETKPNITNSIVESSSVENLIKKTDEAPDVKIKVEIKNKNEQKSKLSSLKIVEDERLIGRDLKRLYVSGIDASLTEDKIKQLFKDCTDLVLPKRIDGNMCDYCYLNFKNENEARNALVMNNGKIVGTCKLTVNYAFTLIKSQKVLNNEDKVNNQNLKSGHFHIKKYVSDNAMICID